MSEDREKFLSRWSRRKIVARGGAGEPDRDAKPASPASPPATPPSIAGASTESRAPLPPIEELRGVKSEYRDFLRPEVDESLRRTALKKLFQDPHFNIMDGLDTYIDDYTKADPIPEAMLRTLNQAKGLLFDREDEQGTGVEQHADAADRSPQATEEVEIPKRSFPDAKEDGNPPQPGPDTPSTTT